MAFEEYDALGAWLQIFFDSVMVLTLAGCSANSPGDRALRIAATSLIVTIALGLAIAVASGGIRNRSIGGSDAANTLIVARNLVAGRGFVVDHVIYFAPTYPAITHPEDSYPLLHPTLIASLAYLTHDVFVGGHLLESVFVFVYFGVLPLLALRRYGDLAGVSLCGFFLALEDQSYFGKLVNDPGAMVLYAAAVLELVRSTELEEGRASNAALARGALLGLAAVLFKSSVGFFLFGLLACLVIVDKSRPMPRRLARAGVAFAVLAIGHVPVLWWHSHAHGELGLPQNAFMRNFARSIATEENFWSAWERSRTYLPAHPDAVLPFKRVLEEQGVLHTLLLGPLARAWHGFRAAFVSGHVLPLAWLVALAAAVTSSRSRTLAKIALVCVACSLLVPAYSHYEPRYFHPLRPVVALLAMQAVLGFADTLTASARLRFEWGVCVALALLAALGLLGAWVSFEPVLDVVLVVAAVTGLALRAGGARGRAVTIAVAFVLGIALAARIPLGVRKLSRIALAEPNPDFGLGRFVAARLPPGGALMARRQMAVSLYSGHPTVVTPFHTEDVCAAAKRYDVGWLLVRESERVTQTNLDALSRRLKELGRFQDHTLYELDCDR